MNKANRERLLALLAMGILALLVADRLILTPMIQSWKARSQRIQELTQSISKGNLLLEREQSFRDRWASMKTRTLPEDVSVAENELLKAVDRWAQESRISFTSLKPRWKRNDADFMTLECRADAFGGIQAVTRFLYEIEKDPLALKVDEVEIIARDNGGQQLSLGVRFSGLRLLASDK